MRVIQYACLAVICSVVAAGVIGQNRHAAHKPVKSARPAGRQRDEVRGIWVARWSLSSPQAVRNIVAAAKRHNFNTLFVQVRGSGEAWYHSDLEPRAEELRDQPADFDPLAVMISEAHAAGIKVHAWMNTFLTWQLARAPRSPNHIVNRHPDWFARDRDNRCSMTPTSKVEGIFLQPSNPEVQEHLYRVFTDVANRYDVDGIHFDYVRYAGPDYDFSTPTLVRFAAYMENRMSDEGRRALQSDPSRFAYVHMFPKEWADWRRAQVTNLVKRVAETVHARKPWLQVSAAVFANPEDAFHDKGQDWSRWLAEGYLDAVCPMAYSRNMETVIKQIRHAVTAANGKHVYAGVGSWRMSAGDTAKTIAGVRKLGVQGVTLFSYDGITADGRRTQYLDYLQRSCFPSRAGVPRMGWRGDRR